jgi:hypothetical protein
VAGTDDAAGRLILWFEELQDQFGSFNILEIFLVSTPR